MKTLQCDKSNNLQYIGVYVNFGIPQFGKIFTYSCTTVRVSNFEIKNSSILYGNDLDSWNKYIYCAR